MWRNLFFTVGVCLSAVAELQAQTHWTDWFYRLPLAEPARVRHWVETLRHHPEASQRLEAVRRLAQTDPRAHPDVIPALVDALRRDPVAAVRQLAADTLGRFPVLSSQAGVALEEAMDHDPVEAVRSAARQALWEYHLLGYSSPKGVGGFVGQTVEPPLASPSPALQTGAAVLSMRPPFTHPEWQPRPVASVPATATVAVESRRRWFPFLPSLLPTAPTAKCTPQGTVTLMSESPEWGMHILQTAEPPLAVPRGQRVADVEWQEPPVAVPLRKPVRVVQLPPIAAALPPLVPPPATPPDPPSALPPGRHPTAIPSTPSSGDQNP